MVVRYGIIIGKCLSAVGLKYEIRNQHSNVAIYVGNSRKKSFRSLLASFTLQLQNILFGFMGVKHK